MASLQLRQEFLAKHMRATAIELCNRQNTGWTQRGEPDELLEITYPTSDVSATFLQCTLKGLHRSPRIIAIEDAMNRPDVLTAEDVSCLVIPDGCLGLPTLAALEQGIKVIAVRENKNLGSNRRLDRNRSRVGIAGCGFWASRTSQNRRHHAHVAADQSRTTCRVAARGPGGD
jgi:hypothetical protein